MMKKLSIIGIAAFCGAVVAAGCSDDTDNPGKPTAGTNAGGDDTGGSKSNGGTSGKDSTAGKGGSAEPVGGSPDVPVAGNGAGGSDVVEPSCADVYADRPEGKKEIPHDADG